MEAASPQIKAMILLGVNAGFGCTDCATLPLQPLIFKGGWVNYPRPRTGVARRCPFSPETIDAIKAAIKHRPRSRRTILKKPWHSSVSGAWVRRSKPMPR